MRCWFALLTMALVTAVLPPLACGIDDAHGSVSLPVVFEPNRGQAEAGALFISRSDAYTLSLGPGGVALQTARGAAHLRFAGANRHPSVAGEAPTGGHSNYFLGSDRSTWRSGVPHFAAVRYGGIYEGIDALFYARGGELEFDFVVSPGARAEEIRIALAGAQLELQLDGTVALKIGDVQWTLRAPVAFQEIDGVQQPVEASFVLAGGELSFAIGAYDRAHTLTIDPVISFSTLFSGSVRVEVHDLAVDSGGNMYVVGETWTWDLPLANPHQPANAGGYDSFIAKFSPSGTLLFSTYFGGQFDDRGARVALDPGGNPVMAGHTKSTDFPVTGGPVGQPCQASCYDPFPFAAKFTSSGSLAFAVLLTVRGSVADVAVGPDGSLYAVGTVAPGELILVDPLFEAPADSIQGYLLRLTADASAFVFSTYLPAGPYTGTVDVNYTHPAAVAVDAAGFVYVAGSSGYPKFPVKNAIDSDPMDADIFLTKFAPDGQSLVFSTFWGGAGRDTVRGMGIDASGGAVVVGFTTSADFPLTENAIQRDCRDTAGNSGIACSFAVRFAPDAQSVIYSTFLAGGDVSAISVAADGTAHIAGDAAPPYLPTLRQVQQMTATPNSFLVSLDAAGRLTFSTAFGGLQSDEDIDGLAHRGSTLYAAGGITSGENYIPTTYNDFPLVNPYMTTPGGSFITRISATDVAALSVSPNRGWLFLVRNVGTRPMEVMSITSPTLALAGDCRGTLLPGDFCPMGVIVDLPKIGYIDVTTSLASTASRYAFRAEPYFDDLYYSGESLLFTPRSVFSEGDTKYTVIYNLRKVPLDIGLYPSGDSWEIKNDCPSPLPAGARCTVSFRFQPVTSGGIGGFVSVRVGDRYDATRIYARGRAVPNAVDFFPESLTFGRAFVGEPSPPRLATLRNVSSTPVTLLGFSAIGPQFSQTNDCPAVLQPRQFCNVWITFHPIGNGHAYAALKVEHDGYRDYGGEIYFNGEGQVRSQFTLYSLQPIYSFIGHDALTTAYLRNDGETELSVTSVDAPANVASDFAECVNVAPGQTCGLALTISSAPLGDYTYVLTVHHTGSGNPQLLHLPVIMRRAVTAPAAIDFGLVPVGTTSSRWLYVGTVLHPGYDPYGISPLAVDGPFQITQPFGPCPNPMQPYTACAFVVSHTGATTGTITGTITFTDSDYPDLPYIIDLSANVVPRTRAPKVGGKRGLGSAASAPTRNVGAKPVRRPRPRP